MSESPVEAVLRVLYESVDPLGGYDISRRSGVRPARMYPILLQLEESGRIVAEWETEATRRLRRRLYRIAS